MANQQRIHKSLAGQEDILYGEGEVSQERSGGTYPISKVRSIYPVNSLAELEALDSDKFPKAALYEDDGITYYVYNTDTSQYEVTASSSGSYVGELPPAIIPRQGDRWTRCTDMKGFIWYVDVDGGQWVEDRPSYDIGSDRVVPFETLDEAINAASIFEGAALNLKERSAGNGGGAMWDVVPTSSVTPNGFDIVQSSVIPALSLKLRFTANKTINASQVGVVGNYDTDDTESFKFALGLAASKGYSLDLGDLVIKVTESIDFPEGTNLIGSSSPKFATFPLRGAEKDKLRPGYKHLLSGAAIFYSGTATKTYTTNRSDRYASMRYCFLYPFYAPITIKGVALILDVDVLDAQGNITSKANDNGSDADAIFINNGTLSLFDDVNIFGYPKDAGYVVHNQTGTSTFDNDYNTFVNSTITGSTAIIGHDFAAGASSEGLTGNKFVNTGIYGDDYHNRPEGDYTRGCLFIDGYMGDQPQSGIRGHSFTSCNMRTYANDSVVTGYCNDISIVNTTMEFPALAGVPEADKAGGFKGVGGTKRVRMFGSGASDTVKLNEYITEIEGPFQFIGAGQNDQAIFGAAGRFIRVGADTDRPFIQLHNDAGSQANGWKIELDEPNNRLEFKSDNQIVMALDEGGGFRLGFGLSFGGTKTISSGEIALGTESFYGIAPESGSDDELSTITGGLFDGQLIMLRTSAAAFNITLKDSTGNLRLQEDRLLSNGQDRIQLMWDGFNWCECFYSNNTA